MRAALGSARGRFGALLLALLALGCSSAPPAAPAPRRALDPARVPVQRHAQGFRLRVEGRCLSAPQCDALLAELVRARTTILGFLGPWRAPGDFRPQGEPRRACPPEPRAVPPAIDVVVLGDGERCFADAEGLTVLAGHIARKDATHELVHFLAGSSWRPIDEGLAVHLTERLWGDATNAGVPALLRARAYHDLGLARDLRPGDLRSGMSRRDYDIAGAFVGWLVDTHGREPFFRLYSGPVAGYAAAYGEDEAAVWARFWRFVRNVDVRRAKDYWHFRARLKAS